MSEKKKLGLTKGLITAGILLLIAGLVCCIAGMTALDWQFDKLGTIRYVYTEYTCEEKIENICVGFENSDIEVSVSDGAESIKITYPIAYNHKGDQRTEVALAAENGTLRLSETSKYKWEDRLFDVNRDSPKVRIFLPSGGDYSLDLNTDVGEISLDGGSYRELKLATDCGAVCVKNASVSGDALIASDVGELIFENFLCGGTLVAETDLGIVSADRTEAAQVNFRTDCGEIRFESLNAEEIALSTDFGNITGSVLGEESLYRIAAFADFGNCNLTESAEGARSLSAHASFGNINIRFID